MPLAASVSHSTTISLTVTSGGTTTQILGNPGLKTDLPALRRGP